MSDEAKIPLVVDLDDTYLRTDMLFEGFWHGMGADPLGTARIVAQNFTNRSELKEKIARQDLVDLSVLPVDQDVRGLCMAARAEGREVVLASGTPQEILERIAAEDQVFDRVIGTEKGTNLTGQNKAERLVREFGEGGFDYVGDTTKDIHVWSRARNAYLARPGTRMRARVAKAGIKAEEVGTSWAWADLARGLRPQQWIKNILLFLPILAAHSFDTGSILSVLLGIIAFSAAASAIYIVNDLTDLSADRVHEKKKKRVFASGAVPIRKGMIFSVALGMLSLLIAAMMSWAMLVVICVYILTTLAYSLRLKRVRWVDVTTLGALYTLRVVAGAVAAETGTSGWIIAFVFPIFLTLACVKRLTELAKAKTDARLPGRAYAKSNRDDLLNISIIGAVAAGGVFIGYSYSEPASDLYTSIFGLRLVAVPLMMWQTRMIRTGWLGVQDYDPIEFALRDRWGLCLILIAVGVLIFST